MDQLLSEAAHLAPINPKEAQTSSLMYFKHSSGYHRNIRIFRCEVLCVLSGSFTLSYDRFIARRVTKGYILLMAPGSKCSLTIDKDSEILLLRPNDMSDICEKINMEELPIKENIISYDIPLLKINKPMETFIYQTIKLIADGILYTEFLDIKIKEFFYLINAYYTKEELAAFLYPLYNKSASFAMFVFKNYRYVKTVSEFARLYNCSLSNFDKNFREAFGTSSYKWMMKRKIDLIFHELKTTNKPLKEVAEDTGFASQSQFTDFCKKHLGASPGQFRKKKVLS